MSCAASEKLEIIVREGVRKFVENTMLYLIEIFICIPYMHFLSSHQYRGNQVHNFPVFDHLLCIEGTPHSGLSL